MANDLISRQAVIDVLKQTGIIQDNDMGHLVVDEINRIPIAYDVDQVVKQIQGVTFVSVSQHVRVIDMVKHGGISPEESGK